MICGYGPDLHRIFDAGFGYSVALSADGNTALIGGPGACALGNIAGKGVSVTAPATCGCPNTEIANPQPPILPNPCGLNTPGYVTKGVGAAWVFTRSGSTWSQGSKLTGTDETGTGQFGFSAALSADGNTALIGGNLDNGTVGAAWMFTRSGSNWTQQGAKLTGTDESGAGQFGISATLSANGNTALIGAPTDNGGVGAAWVFSSRPPPPPPTGTAHPTITSVKCKYGVAAARDTCTATVSDGSGPSATRPTGRVQFSSGAGGVFSAGNACNLSPSSFSNVSSCSVQFIPPATASPIITGHYLGDGSHLASSGKTSSLLSANVARPIMNGSISPSSFFAAPSGSAVSLSRVYGAIVRVRLRAPARVVFTVQQPAVGRRDAHNRCVAPTRANRHHRGCTRYLTLRGNFTLVGQAGLSHLRFRGRIGARPLKPGSYRLVATPYIGKVAGVRFYITFHIKNRHPRVVAGGVRERPYPHPTAPSDRDRQPAAGRRLQFAAPRSASRPVLLRSGSVAVAAAIGWKGGFGHRRGDPCMFAGLHACRLLVPGWVGGVVGSGRRHRDRQLDAEVGSRPGAWALWSPPGRIFDANLEVGLGEDSLAERVGV